MVRISVCPISSDICSNGIELSEEGQDHRNFTDNGIRHTPILKASAVEPAELIFPAG